MPTETAPELTPEQQAFLAEARIKRPARHRNDALAERMQSEQEVNDEA